MKCQHDAEQVLSHQQDAQQCHTVGGQKLLQLSTIVPVSAMLLQCEGSLPEPCLLLSHLKHGQPLQAGDLAV